jgi:hypothetical protein
MMRILILFLLIPSVLLAQFYSPSYGGNVTRNNLIAAYDFSNPSSYPGTGTTVNNTTGKSIPATLAGSPTYFADPGYVQFLPANGNYMMVGDLRTYYPQVTSTTRSGVFTMSLWFNPTLANGVVVSDLNSTVVAGGYHTTDIEMVAGYLKFSVWPKNSVISTASAVTLNAWHHVVLVYTGNQVKAYLDNVLVGTASYTRDGPAMGSLTSPQYFGIGAYDNVTNMGHGGWGHFLLADFKFYNSALGTAEINNIYQQEKTNYNLVFFLDAGNTNSYPGTGTSWKDISGAGITATNASNNGTTTAVAYNAAASGSMYFNGYGYSDFTFNLNGATTLTVEMWAYPTSLSGGMFFGFNLYDVFTANGTLGFNTAGGDSYGLNTTQTSGFANTWKHYVFVMNSGSVTSNKIYVNGVQQSLALQFGTIYPGNATFNSGSMRIGCWRWDTTYLQQMYMTKFKVYNRELTQTEITAKFNKDKARHGL